MDENDLRELLHDAGVDVLPSQAWEMLFHLDAVLRANESLNLTAITDRDEAIILHIVDSLTCLPELSAAPDGPLADIGSGAGFPGIPLAIATQRPTTLVESRGRKALFLSMVVAGLSHEIEVASQRAEDFALDVTGEYTACVARAVGELAELVELAAPLLSDGGILVCLKGSPDEEEVRAGELAAARVGLSPSGRRRTTLPEGDAEREIISYRKSHEPSVDLPRRPGMARKRPLA